MLGKQIFHSFRTFSTSSYVFSNNTSFGKNIRKALRLKKPKAPMAIVPPDRSRPHIDYFLPRVRVRKARKTADPEPQPRKFPEVQRSWDLREIPDNEEALRRHDLLAPVVVEKVNESLVRGQAGRLFAVVLVMAKQFLVKTEDIIILRGNNTLKPGESIRLEKVLAVGGGDFTLMGRPLLPVDQVAVQATVVEKTLSHTKIWFLTVPRENTRVWRFIREPLTYLRINNISVLNEVNKLPDVRGVQGRVFFAEDYKSKSNNDYSNSSQQSEQQ